jgi:hypothetical protein
VRPAPAGLRGRLGDDRLAHVRGQVAAHARDGRAHIVDRFLHRLFETEFGGDRDHAVLHFRVDVLEALGGGDRVLDLARDVVLELGRRGARQRGGDHHRGQVDVGKVLHLHRVKDSRPPNVSSTNSITAGIGLRIDQEDTFIM